MEANKYSTPEPTQSTTLISIGCRLTSFELAPPLPVASSQVRVKEEIYNQDTDEDERSTPEPTQSTTFAFEDGNYPLNSAPPAAVASSRVRVKDEIYDQDTDEEEDTFTRSSGAGHVNERHAPVKGEMYGSELKYKLSSTCSERAVKEMSQLQRKRRSDKNTNEMQCYNCSAFKRREKFCTKQWERGLLKQGKRTYCRRCEEKILVRKQVGSKLENLCVRMHTKESRRGKAKYLSTLIPLNTKLTFLPSELTLDGYTREPWSLEDNIFESAWQTTTLRCLVGVEKLTDFVKFLVERRKSAYGTFILQDGTDGFFFVPFYQLAQDANMSSTPKSLFPTIICKYILGLGLIKTKNKIKSPIGECLSSGGAKDDTEDYISSTALGSLLLAQSRTNNSLAVVPKGSVKSAPKFKSSPNRKTNTGWSRDWYGQKLVVTEEK